MPFVLTVNVGSPRVGEKFQIAGSTQRPDLVDAIALEVKADPSRIRVQGPDVYVDDQLTYSISEGYVHYPANGRVERFVREHVERYDGDPETVAMMAVKPGVCFAKRNGVTKEQLLEAVAFLYDNFRSERA